MKKLLFILTGIILFGCKPKFDPNAEYKPIDVIYGIIDPDADKQYISVTEIFQNTDGTNAETLARDNNNVYNDDFSVFIINKRTGYELQLEKEIIEGREEGTFSNTDNILYTFENRNFTILDSNNVYRVEVRRENEKVSYAEIKTVNNILITRPSLLGNPQLNLRKGDDFNDEIISVRNFVDDKLLFQVNLFLIYDSFDSDGAILSTDTLEYLVQTKEFYDAESKDPYEQDFNISGNSLITFISNNISPIIGKEKLRIFSPNTYLTVEAYGPEMFEYIKAEENFSTLSQSKPFYTNIFDASSGDEQAGVFTSVKKETRSGFSVASSTIKYLQDNYSALGF